MKVKLGKRLDLWVFYFLLLGAVILFFNLKDLNLKLVSEGWTPQLYVTQKLHPENFRNDFTPGIAAYDQSLPMISYVLLAKYFHISPDSLVPFHLVLQTYLLIFSLVYLSLSIFRHRFVIILITTGAIISSLSTLNLARFGILYDNLKLPLYYTPAMACSFIALGAFLRKKYVTAFVFVIFSLLNHPMIGIFTAAFIFSYLFVRPKIVLNKKFLLGGLIFSVIFLAYSYFTYHTLPLSSGAIPPQAWIKQTKIFSYHWYPDILKVFTEKKQNEFLPLVFSGILYFLSLRYVSLKDHRIQKIVAGTIGCLFLTILGVIFSNSNSPFLIKLSLHRASLYLSFFAVVLGINYLFRKLVQKRLLTGPLAIYALFLLFFSKPGLAFLPLFLLAFIDIREGYLGPVRLRSVRKKSFVLAILVVYSLVFWIFSPEPFPINPSNKSLIPFLKRWYLFHIWPTLGNLWLSRPIFITALVVILGLWFFWQRTSNKRLVYLSGSILLVLVGTRYYQAQQLWEKTEKPLAQDFYTVQLWAKHNTDPNALFAPDPASHLHWRDFSQRSSFGTVREWGFYSILYLADEDAFTEGKKRLAEFDIDLTHFDRFDAAGIPADFTIREAHLLFYSLTKEKILSLAQTYGIDYFIVENTALNSYPNNGFAELPIQYQNPHYKVISTRL